MIHDAEYDSLLSQSKMRYKSLRAMIDQRIQMMYLKRLTTRNAALHKSQRKELTQTRSYIYKHMYNIKREEALLLVKERGNIWTKRSGQHKLVHVSLSTQVKITIA